MKTSDLSFLVIGAGAVGGITAGLLKSKGHDVEILCKSEKHASLISGTGLIIKGVRGDFSVKIPAYNSISGIKGQKDIILHATKATDMVSAARTAMPVLKKGGYVISLQNGFCEDDLAEVAGRDRVIGCVTGWGATMESEGVLSMTSNGDFIIGYPGKNPDEFLNLIAQALSSVMPVRTTENITGHLYSKLIINSCITSLGAICGLSLGKMLAITKIRRIFIEIIREAVALADKMDIKIEIFGDRLDFRDFVSRNGFFDDVKRHMMIRIIGLKYRRLKSSSLQSLERGKQTEVDYLNGYLIRNGLRFGVDTPVNKAITDMIHEIENHRRMISVHNFNEAVFERFN